MAPPHTHEHTQGDIGLHWDNGKENGNYCLGFRVIGVILGLDRDNGKENGNYHNGESNGKENGK